jgi:RNA polymerase sigma factor (sigma-70 family)
VRSKVLPMLRNPTDAQLVIRVRAGDDAAFGLIVDRYREPLMGFAARLLGGSHADADDVVQDALIRAHRALRASDTPMALRSWLYMIVRNRAYDHLRATAARRTDSDERLALVAVPDGDPADRAVAREAFDGVVASIAALPERQRLALVGREINGDSHVELASALRTTIPGVKSLLVRSRQTVAAAVAA